MTNNGCAKMLEMIPGASGLQIKCGLFLWLSIDVRKVFQVLDVPCMGCDEINLVNGETTMGGVRELNGIWVRDGDDG